MITFDWSKIINGCVGFEKLACRYVSEFYNSPSGWIPTQATRDGNKDAYTIILGFKPNEVTNEQWWMEAKYSTNVQKLTRYRLDATIVSAILSEHISRIIFVTNILISPKTIIDIRIALEKAVECHEVFFVSKYSLEYWLSQNTNIVKEFFGESENFTFSFPDLFIIDEMEVFSNFNNHLSFRESLHHVVKGQIYHGYFSVFSNTEKNLVIEANQNQQGIRILSDKKLPVKRGENPLHIVFKLEDSFCNIITKQTEAPSFVINSLELLLKYNPTPVNGHTKIKIQEQENIGQKIIDQLTDFLRNPITKVCVLTGISGIGKSYLLNEIQSRKCLQSEILFSIEFVENGYENINIIVNIILFILFPYIDPADLDDTYLLNIKRDNFITPFFLQLIRQKQDFEQLEAIMETNANVNPIFPSSISINKRLIILDDIQKLSQHHKAFLYSVIKEVYHKKMPVFILLCGQPQMIDNQFFLIKQTLFLEEFVIKLSAETITDYINSNSNLTFKLDKSVIKSLFNNLVELFIFVQYLQESVTDITSIEEFIEFCKLFKRTHIYEKHILNQFNTLKCENEKEFHLCSSIYWSFNGIEYNNICEEFSPYIFNLFSKNFIKYNNENKIVPYQDIDQTVFRKSFPKSDYTNVLIQSSNEKADFLHMLIKSSFNINELKEVVTEIETLCDEKKFYTVYYILQDIFEQIYTNTIKNHITESIYYRLYRAYALAATNLSKQKSGTSLFKEIYDETYNTDDVDILYYVRTSVLWELQNSSYEWLKFKQSEQYAIEQMALIEHLIALNVLNGDKNKFMRYQNLLVIKTLIESEKNTSNIIKTFESRFSNMEYYGFHQRALSFKVRFAYTLLTRDLSKAETMLQESMKSIAITSGYEDKFYLWASTGYYFIQLIKNDNPESLSLLFTELEKMKQNYYNDYRKRMLAVASYYISIHDIESSEKALFFDITIERALRPRQEGFYHEILAVYELFNGNIQIAQQELDKAEIIFADLSEYNKIIIHNRNIILTGTYKSANIKFYTGGIMKQSNYYLDPRCLY